MITDRAIEQTREREESSSVVEDQSMTHLTLSAGNFSHCQLTIFFDQIDPFEMLFFSIRKKQNFFFLKYSFTLKNSS